jgi:aspartate carbamoyltransferase regulatory subunit
MGIWSITVPEQIASTCSLCLSAMSFSPQIVLFSTSASNAKDIIKIENRLFNEREANELAIFAPGATINVIDDYQVQEKFEMSIPTFIEGVFECPNSNCITLLTRITVKSSKFKVQYFLVPIFLRGNAYLSFLGYEGGIGLATA